MTYEKSYEDKKKKSKAVNKGEAKTKSSAKVNTRSRAMVKSHALESTDRKVVAAVNELPKVRTIKAKRTVPFPTSVVFVSVICTVLFMFMMLTMAQINEFTQDISALQTKLSDLQSQEEELKLNVELKNDLRVIEDVAVNELGMVKADEVDKQYVVIGNEDKIEVVVPQTTENSLVNTVMSAIGENFRELMEYIN
ncbi:MAG: septum formation initiator family protein [Clostridia bacterium]|nr:septum formation initiator family protein [Clostridia bacterium]